MFKKQNTNGVGKRERRFIDTYGDVTFDEAYPVYVAKIQGFFNLQDKIDKFENYLISIGVNCTQSNISESRYYFWNGIKYRFSSHVYPTGSMTSDICVDFAADKHLINSIEF